MTWPTRTSIRRYVNAQWLKSPDFFSADRVIGSTKPAMPIIPARPKKCHCEDKSVLGAETSAPVSDILPSVQDLKSAGDLTVYDEEGRQWKFRDVMDGRSDHEDLVVQRHIILFVRHFFCGVCQEYLRTLSKLLPPSQLPTGTSLTVVGCGSPSLLPFYIRTTGLPYPIFTDPTGTLYESLAFARTLAMASKKPEYISVPFVETMLRSVRQILHQVGRFGRGGCLSGGDWWRVGGELLIERTNADPPYVNRSRKRLGLDDDAPGWKATFVHRMRKTTDHLELPELRLLLGLEPGRPSRPLSRTRSRRSKVTTKN